MQDIELYIWKVRVWPIMPNSRILSEWSQMDQNETHTQYDLQQRSNTSNQVSHSWHPASSQAEMKGKKKIRGYAGPCNIDQKSHVV